MNNTLLLIDGHNFLFRAFSIPFTFYSKSNTPLHVISTYLGLIRKTIRHIEGDNIKIAVAFDNEAPTTNHAIFSEYKANRIIDYSEMEDHPFIHLPFIKDTLEYLEIKYFEMPTIEADDIIATISTKYIKDNPKSNVLIASNDTDFYQLVDDNIKIIKNSPQGNIILDSDFIKNKLGIMPHQYTYFKSLTGDKADNINGIPKVGPVRAKRIVNNELEFDDTPFKKLIDRNMQLIEFNKSVDIDINFDLLNLSERLNLTNAQIFDDCNF